jgi:hypothetical protein
VVDESATTAKGRETEMIQQIKASEIQPGMVVDIYGDERIGVTGAKANGYGAVVITDSIRTRGLSEGEAVTLVGHFNP